VPARPQPQGNKAKPMATDEKAALAQVVAHIKSVGRQQAFLDFTARRPPFYDGERQRYVVCVDEKRVVVAHGGYGLDSLSGLADALETAAQKHSKVVLDASGVTFADSSFLNLVLGVHRLTSLRLAAPAQQLRRLLELTGADGVLAVRATVEEAVMS